MGERVAERWADCAGEPRGPRLLHAGAPTEPKVLRPSEVRGVRRGPPAKRAAPTDCSGAGHAQSCAARACRRDETRGCALPPSAERSKPSCGESGRHEGRRWAQHGSSRKAGRKTGKTAAWDVVWQQTSITSRARRLSVATLDGYHTWLRMVSKKVQRCEKGASAVICTGGRGDLLWALCHGTSGGGLLRERAGERGWRQSRGLPERPEFPRARPSPPAVPQAGRESSPRGQ